MYTGFFSQIGFQRYRGIQIQIFIQNFSFRQSFKDTEEFKFRYLYQIFLSNKVSKIQRNLNSGIYTEFFFRKGFKCIEEFKFRYV